MAVLTDIVNSINCGAGEAKGSGLYGCKQDIKRTTTLALIQRGYEFQDGEIDTLAGVQLLQQKGKAIVLQGVVEMADNTADDNVVTRTGSGEKVVAGKNPYEYTATFDNGLHFHKALTSLSGHRQYDIVFYDSKGDLFFTQTKAGGYKGFTLGMFENGKYMMSNGADAASQSVTFQLINRLEFDERVSWITADNLDYNASEDLDGYNDATLKLTAPSNLATTLNFSIFTNAVNHKVAIEGLENTDFLYTVNGVTTAISVLTAGVVAGDYIATVPAVATGEILTLSMFDSVNNAYIINTDGTLFKSNIATTVVV